VPEDGRPNLHGLLAVSQDLSICGQMVSLHHGEAWLEICLEPRNL
jgi:hypothetical protein